MSRSYSQKDEEKGDGCQQKVNTAKKVHQSDLKAEREKYERQEKTKQAFPLGIGQQVEPDASPVNIPLHRQDYESKNKQFARHHEIVHCHVVVQHKHAMEGIENEHCSRKSVHDFHHQENSVNLCVFNFVFESLHPPQRLLFKSLVLFEVTTTSLRIICL